MDAEGERGGTQKHVLKKFISQLCRSSQSIPTGPLCYVGCLFMRLGLQDGVARKASQGSRLEPARPSRWIPASQVRGRVSLRRGECPGGLDQDEGGGGITPEGPSCPAASVPTSQRPFTSRPLHFEPVPVSVRADLLDKLSFARKQRCKPPTNTARFPSSKVVRVDLDSEGGLVNFQNEEI